MKMDVNRRVDDIALRLERIERVFNLPPLPHSEWPREADRSVESLNLPHPIKPTAAPAPTKPTFSPPIRETAHSVGSGEPTQWEQLIGGKWSLWIGSVTVFLAMSFFLAYTWRYLNETGRFGVSVAIGLAFLAAGMFFKKRPGIGLARSESILRPQTSREAH